MNDSSRINPVAVLFHLEDQLARLLAEGLHLAGCHVAAEHAMPDATIVFCAAESGVLQDAHLAVVVVSRLPEDGDWLDALEAGATDYCGTPFETVQLRWLVAAHIRPLAAQASA